MMKKIPSVQATTLIIFFFLTYGCAYSLEPSVEPTVPSNFRETSFLTGIPCPAPCWRELQIGISSYNQTMKMISSLEYINQQKSRVADMLVPDINSENWVPGKVITAICMYGNNHNKPCLEIVIANDKLKDIDITLNYELKLNDVVGYLGNPDYVGYKNVSTDQVLCKVELIWVSKQLILYSISFSGSDAENYCYPVQGTGIPDANLIISNVNFRPDEEINMTIKNDQLAQYVGMKLEK